MRSRPGDDFRSPVRETVIINGVPRPRLTSMSASLGPVALKAFPLLFFRMDDSHGRFGHCFA
jgi:hypothetical protein